MFTIETPRLILAKTPLEVMKARLEHDDFVADVPVTVDRGGEAVAEVLRVHFPPEWPGDALTVLPLWLAQREARIDEGGWSETIGGTIIERAELVAVGGMGLKGAPDENGAVEIGYGVNPSYQNRGYATEIARGLVAWALAQPGVRRVTAECLEDNAGSIRVLEKVGFRRVGRRMDGEGPLLLWEIAR